MPLAAWHVTDALEPKKLAIGAIELEKHLEDWIVRHPALVEHGLTVVQRQLKVEGGFLDLLCVDLQGRATIVEIKRGKLIRETISQAIDYASSIATMPTEQLREHVRGHFGGSVPDDPAVASLLDDSSADEREIAVVVVGVGAEPGLDRMIDFLGSRFDFPIRAVTFEVFALPSGERVLIREEREPEQVHAPATSSTIDEVVARAGGPDSPNGRRMRVIADAATRNGLHVRPYKWSLMLAPPEKKTRFLFNLFRWSHKDELAISYSADAIAEFYPVTPPEITTLLGEAHDKVPILDDADAFRWAEGLDALFATVREASNEGGSDRGES